MPVASGRSTHVSICEVTRKESKVLRLIAMGDTLGLENSGEE